MKLITVPIEHFVQAHYIRNGHRTDARFDDAIKGIEHQGLVHVSPLDLCGLYPIRDLLDHDMVIALAVLANDLERK